MLLIETLDLEMVLKSVSTIEKIKILNIPEILNVPDILNVLDQGWPTHCPRAFFCPSNFCKMPFKPF
jgi:hypothetical protein